MTDGSEGACGAPRRRIEAVFEGALEQSPEARASWLRAECGDDEALCAEVEALLEAHAIGERIDEQLRFAGTRSARSSSDRKNDSAPSERRIGPYRVLRELGRGGMGVVYLAERDDGQFRQRVAVKLLRGSPDADELQQRFRAERQILASLAHPNIAHLLDGGVTDGQLPYLVMEYVDGLPINTYCDRHRLNVRERLRLFQDVCTAVQHAHSNLIIHRDLKPGNILVTGEGQVKLLDFGIAKLLNPSVAGGRAPVTRTEFRVLTPEYASPEQVRGETLTTTSDVYALGVILYELLAGRPPFGGTARAPAEMARLIEECEPPAPSALFGARTTATKGGWEPAAAPRTASARGPDPTPESIEVAAARDSTVEALRRTLRGDVDAIVAMSLRKEPGRRYGSADLLATDIGRYLDGHTVLARKSSGWYRLGKLVHRHRRTSVAATLVLLSVLVGGAAALGQARIANSERERADGARVVAERALRESEQVRTFMMSLFEASNPLESGSGGVTARDLLRRGAARADRLSDEPLIQAQMFEIIGLAQRGLGEYAGARTSLERALAIRRAQLGEAHLDVTRTLYHLTEVMRNGGQYAEGTAAARAGLAARERNPEPGWPDVPAHLMQLAGMVIYSGEIRTADTLAERALALRSERLGAADTAVASSLEYLAAVKRRRGMEAEAESYLEQAVVIRRQTEDEDGLLGNALLRLGDLFASRGRVAEADSLFRESLHLLRQALGPAHPRVLDAETTFALFRAEQGEHEAAEATLRRVAGERAEIYGENHPAATASLASLARVLMLRGAFADAEALLRRTLESRITVLGPDHGAVAGELVTLAQVLTRRGRHAEADSVMGEALRIRAPLGRPLFGLTQTQHAELLLERGELARADTLFRRGIELMLEEVDVHHHDLRRVHGAMARLLEAQGRPSEAEHFRQLSLIP